MVELGMTRELTMEFGLTLKIFVNFQNKKLKKKAKSKEAELVA